MFKSITFKERQSNNDSYRLIYILEDTKRIVKLNVPIEKYIYDNRGDASIIPSGIISMYSEWKENVPKNLAFFYHTMLGHLPITEQNKLLYVDREWTDAYFPSIEYGKKYFKCTINQMLILKYTGTKSDAKPIPGTVL